MHLQAARATARSWQSFCHNRNMRHLLYQVFLEGYSDIANLALDIVEFF